ncbi:MAG: putative NEK protein kinase [Streblomastix strix]|uniref:Putative NEK protein kinase n=1 Tax=Streblomastix strix TaxID=222440 RepID=A0A5J4VR58_9EUKA|nr:MAG: putative NEK protein kinase [Streblomastix strix]
MIKSDETNSAGAFRKNVIEISNSTFQNITQSESGNGTAINAELKTGSLLKIADQSQFTYCVSSSGNGGGICLIIFGGTAELSGVTINYCNGTNGGGIFISVISEISVELSNISFNNCSAVNGGGIYSNINAGGKLIFKDSCKFSQCKASSGNGGGMYIDIDFASQFEFKIIDALIKQCQAQSDSSYSYPTGYGGGIFLTGNGDYNPLTLRLDLKGMQIYNNIASKGGQSLYVVMTKVAEWCRYGISGKYVKGNYSDGISIKIVLQGIPVNSSTFNSYTLTQITSQQNYLEDYWKVDWAEYYTQSTGNDSSPCSSTTPCKTFEAANIKNNINSETSIHIYVYDSASIEDTIIISQTYSPRIFRNFPLDSTLLSDILIKADGKFIITVKVLFQLINFIIESISLQQFVPGIYGSSLTAEINLQDCEFHMQDGELQIRKCFIYLEKGGNHAISNLISKYVQSEENIIRINFNEAGSLNISESQFENITRIGEQITGGTIRAVLQHSSNRFNITDCNFTTCKAQDSQGGAIYAEILNSNAQISITRTQFLQCEAQSGGGLFAKILIDGKLILEDSCEFRQCKATSGNGGGIYADLTFKASTQASFLISDALFQNCQAITSSSVPSSTGFGGGIFLIGNGDYDPSTLRLDLKGMKIYNNTANNGGQSLYVMMTKLAEWCRYGILGEYVKGNYSDGISNLNELEGTIMEINIFQNSSQQQIQTQKYHLQYLWTQIPILTEVEVTLNISNTNEPLQFTIKGNNMIPGKLCVKIVDVGPRKSVNEKFQMQQYDAFEYIYPPYDSSTPITVIGIPQTEQIATFGMKDYMWFDYKNENYYIFISNDRQIFTGYEGKEDSGAFLDVIELKDGSSFPIWKIVLIVVICFVIIIAIVFAIFFLYKLKGEKDKKQDKMQIYINQGQTQTLDQNAPFNTTWEKSDFEKVKKLGKGAFSTVWCMKEKSTQRVFAVKVVDFDTQQEQESILKERDILLSIYQTILNSGSPTQYIHVVQPLGFFLNEDEDSYRAYLVLEYCSRGDLRKYIQNMKKSGTEISDRRAFELIAQIISAVHQLHANSIIHGDLKPENVLVMEDYKIKLSDFGLARKIQEGRDYLTAMGGTTPYLGPELLQKKVESNSYQQDENATSVQKRLIQTPASDIWAVGTMMFELLAQHHPFFDNNGGDIPLLELVRRITEEQPAELPSHYSDNLRKLIKDMLTKDPSRRITSEDILEIPEVAEFLTNN